MGDSYLSSAIKQFSYYKSLGERTIDQLTMKELTMEFSTDANSISVIVKHMVGNMFSRWTNFMTEDGEKSWRHRDNEFINTYTTKSQILEHWEKGWDCLFNAIQKLNPEDLTGIVYIRNEGHTVIDAINRQMMHYAYHIGQIVYIGKQIKGSAWQSLSIPKGESESYNKDKFSKGKDKKHFTDEV